MHWSFRSLVLVALGTLLTAMNATASVGFAGTVPVVGDFDGDGRSDIGVYYAPGGDWYLFKSTEGFWQTQFGFDGTFPLGGTLR